jgi:hypothetical protein
MDDHVGEPQPEGKRGKKRLDPKVLGNGQPPPEAESSTVVDFKEALAGSISSAAITSGTEIDTDDKAAPNAPIQMPGTSVPLTKENVAFLYVDPAAIPPQPEAVPTIVKCAKPPTMCRYGFTTIQLSAAFLC